MQVKIFTAENGFLKQKMGETPIPIEDAVNNFIRNLKDFKLQQSQSGEKNQFLTVTVTY
jgi:hypothetical protein